MTIHTLRNARLAVNFDPDGARMRSVHLDDGPNLVLDVSDTTTQALRDAYGGAIVGPLANRVRDGRVLIYDVTYQMPRNEKSVTALHSGPEGLDRIRWTVAEYSSDRLLLKHHLPAGHGGLPGNRDIAALFSVDKNSLVLHISMTTDAPTPASIAHHPYWRVTSAHRLKIHAEAYLPTDDANLPTGQIATVAGTSFDHRTPRAIAAGTDHNYCIATSRRPAPARVAELVTTHAILHIDSTEPGLQAYSGAYLPQIPAAGIGPFLGIALEPQGWPDAVNTPHFPSVIVTADHPYAQTTKYTLHSAT
ncbi:MAG: galactose mutarotase [Pseudomonadota bacterium]